MSSFRDIAYQILQESGKPLHYREITDSALKKGVLKTDGRTPWATMMAKISTDIKEKGENSRFIKTDPGYFDIKRNVILKVDSVKIKVKVDSPRLLASIGVINKLLSTKQKGDLAENRVAELITLYGNVGLSCYKPVSDDEGIDLIVKRRGKFEVVYLQIKSTYGYRNRGFVTTIKERKVINQEKVWVVFVYFDLSTGDLFDTIFCVPAPKFLELTKNDKKKTDDRVFTVGLKNPEKSKFAEFILEKRELAKRISEIMDTK